MSAGRTTPQPPVSELFDRGQPTVSFEFFPPKDEAGLAKLWSTVDALTALEPSFVSVTYGAGGTTRDRTAQIAARLVGVADVTTVAHLTCVGASRRELTETIEQFATSGVANLLALRGDPPSGFGGEFTRHADGLAHADELIALIKGVGDYCVGVAAFTQGHPESRDLDEDARTLAAKAAAGADYAITQLFFTVQEYERLRERASAAGADIPILAGLMPITNVKQIERFAVMSGAPVPTELSSALEAVADDPGAVRRVGIEAASNLAAGLLEAGAPGLHCYTLNRSEATIEILRNIGLRDGADPTCLAQAPTRVGPKWLLSRTFGPTRDVEVRPAQPLGVRAASGRSAGTRR